MEPITYAADHANGTVEVTLADRRLVAKTQGRGALDRLRIIDIALTELDKFCVVPTVAIQNVVDATGTDMVYDRSYDAEFIFSYRENGKRKIKRIFVDRGDEAWQRLVAELHAECPSASLLDLEPAEAQKQIGAMSGTKALSMVFGIIVGVPLIVGLIVLLSRSHH